MTYADYTASGRCLDFVEEFMTEKVMPTYANTHTEASATGLQTTRFVEEARETILQSDGPAKNETLAVDNMIWPRQRRSFASWLLVTYAASTIAVDCFTDGIWYCAQLESVIGDAVVEPAMIEV